MSLPLRSTPLRPRPWYVPVPANRANQAAAAPRLELLQLDALIKTGPVDHADWNYKPVLGWIQRQRFRLALSFLPKERAGRVLEIGYGSGVFLPELARHCTELYGVDIHAKNHEIAARLRKNGVYAQLSVATAERLPFDDASFDYAVAVSTLEFVADLPAACGEIARILKPNGSLIVITPGHSPLVDFGLRLLTREDAKKDFGDRRQSLIKLLSERFRVKQKSLFPSIGGRFVCLYKGFELQPLRTN
jgi:ubiquinone/menaquinone biosynthesis C-methylase UbiE